MFTYVLKRLLLIIPLVVATSLIIFTIFEFSNIDPVKRILGERSQDEALVQQMRDQMGLNDPAHVRYFRFLKGVPTGNYGTSIRTGQPVGDMIRIHLPATLELAFCALLFSTIVGLVAGIMAGLKRNSLFDYAAMTIAICGVSLPVFWLALLLVYFFGEKLAWLPLDQRYDVLMSGAVKEHTGLRLVDTALAGNWKAFKDAVEHLILPAVTLGTVSSALVARMTRSSILEVRHADFVRTAMAKGLGHGRWVWHILRNALVPVVTIIGLEIPALIGGAVITETIFSWPGMGKLLIDSIHYGDIPTIMGLVMFLTLIFILVNIVVDLLYGVLDPRIRVAGK